MKSARQQCKCMSICLKNGVRIYTTRYGNNFKITIEKAGIPKTGKKIFFIKTTRDSKTGDVTLGVYDKIWDLYKQIATNIINKKNAA